LLGHFLPFDNTPVKLYTIYVMDNLKYIQKAQKRIHRLVLKGTKDYYLTGGTALAFYYKHRFSEDLDYFSQNFKANSCDKIMKYILKETGYNYSLVFEQKGKKLLPLRMYELVLKDGMNLKIDFVQDLLKNSNAVKNGIHSVKDIYCRKINIGLNPVNVSVNDIGREVSAGRQVAKDLYDLYYLSNNYEPLSGFFLNHFSIKQIQIFDSWYRSIDRLDMKIELSEGIGMKSQDKVLDHLDKEIIHELSRYRDTGFSCEGGVEL